MKKKAKRKRIKKNAPAEKGNVQIVNVRINSDGGGNDADRQYKKLKTPAY